MVHTLFARLRTLPDVLAADAPIPPPTPRLRPLADGATPDFGAEARTQVTPLLPPGQHSAAARVAAAKAAGPVTPTSPKGPATPTSPTAPPADADAERAPMLPSAVGAGAPADAASDDVVVVDGADLKSENLGSENAPISEGAPSEAPNEGAPAPAGEVPVSSPHGVGALHEVGVVVVVVALGDSALYPPLPPNAHRACRCSASSSPSPSARPPTARLRRTRTSTRGRHACWGSRCFRSRCRRATCPTPHPRPRGTPSNRSDPPSTCHRRAASRSATCHRSRLYSSTTSR